MGMRMSMSLKRSNIPTGLAQHSNIESLRPCGLSDPFLNSKREAVVLIQAHRFFFVVRLRQKYGAELESNFHFTPISFCFGRLLNQSVSINAMK